MCLHVCRQPLLGRGGGGIREEEGEGCGRRWLRPEVCRSDEESRALKAQDKR